MDRPTGLDADAELTDDRDGSSRRWPKRLAIGIPVAIVVLVAAALGYREFVVPDAADRLTLGERAATETTESAAAVEPSDPADGTADADVSDPADLPASTVATEPSREAADPNESAAGSAVLDASTWLTGTDSIVGYRVDEVVGGLLDETVAGRTSDVTGTVEIADGAVVVADFTVDMTTLDSGSGARDAALRRSELDTDTFPTATFTLVDDVSLDLDDPSVTVERTVAGSLTLRGETRDVVTEIEARIVDDELQILGLVPIDFDLFEIPLDPPGVSLENTQVEFSLIMRQDA